ncbi:AGAP002624-PA-like protein [Anopheles sinensis]|uniref:AGAP002624-PA-like protein n=1 Tax=Anopheles sinensis TaxID=74873 RepID=A0A084W6L1_ANOSI|nr:AGAP002624-PA-like protein [Anopheles sinensis]
MEGTEALAATTSPVDSTPGSMSSNEAKLLAIVVLGVGSFLCGVLPLYCSQRNRQRHPGMLSFLLCFGAGVLLATSIVHMLPEIRAALNEYAEIVFCTGFFLMYAMDELMLFCGIGAHDHGEEEPIPAGRRRSVDAESDTNSIGSTGRCYGSNEETKSLLEQQRSDSETHLTHRLAENILDVTNVRDTRSIPTNRPVPQSTAVEAHLTGVFGLLLALSMHSLLEGLAIGVQNSGPKVLLLLGAVSAHKFVVGFALGVQLCAYGTRHRCSHILQVLTFSLGSVAGIGIGMGLDGLNQTLTDLIMPALQGLAGGTLLYVTVSEVLPKERSKRQHISRRFGPVQLVAVILGFSLMSVLSLVLTDE